MTVTNKLSGCVSRLDKSVHICMLLTKIILLVMGKNAGVCLYIDPQTKSEPTVTLISPKNFRLLHSACPEIIEVKMPFIQTNLRILLNYMGG